MGDVRATMTGGRWAAAICGSILLVSAALSWSALRTKVATIDEPMHLVAGVLALRDGDYRQDPATPPLAKLWAAVGDVGLQMRVPSHGAMAGDVFFAPDDEPMWCVQTLFETPGTEGDRLIARARVMMLLLGIGVGALVAVWAYQASGAVAAVTAVAMFALDPTVLAHAPVIKTDVPEALALLAVGWITWHVGRRATVPRAVALGLACGAAVNTKFTGLLAGPIVGITLVARAIGPVAWPAYGRTVATRPGRLAVTAVTALLVATLCFAVTWGSYRFRYRPAPSASAAIDMRGVYDRYRRATTAADLGRKTTDAEVAAHRDDAFITAIHWADDRHLLPQAFLAGIAHQAAAVSVWSAFLDGQVYFNGRTAYFPLAVLYKTPVSELAAIAFAGVLGLGALPALLKSTRPADRWSAASLAIPIVAIVASALRARLNIGLRTLLPLYPFVAVAIGCAIAYAWQRRPRLTRMVVGVLAIAQTVAIVRAWPDYIPFFNGFVGGPTEGFSHLADSNLDWGQDVGALAGWQAGHPGVPIYADLFTAVDPEFYGIRCNWLFVPDAAGKVRVNLPDRPAVIAVSATHLVGLYVGPEQRQFFSRLVGRTPREVLHGTIYLYDYRP